MEQLVVNGICQGCAYGLIAVGFALIYSTTRAFHIAHAAVIVAAAYGYYVVAHRFGGGPVLAGLASIAVAAVIGIAIERGVYWPLTKQGASGTVMLLSSLALYIAVTNTLSFIFGDQTSLLVPGPSTTFKLGSSVTVTYPQFLPVVGFCVLGVIFWVLMHRTHFGLLCSAVAEDPVLASILGVRIDAIRIGAIAIGSALGGIGFTLMASDSGVDPNMGIDPAITAVVACILVGIRRRLAPLAGGLLLGVLQSSLIWWIPSRWVSSLTYTLLVMLLLLRPEGLFGIGERLEEK